MQAFTIISLITASTICLCLGKESEKNRVARRNGNRHRFSRRKNTSNLSEIYDALELLLEGTLKENELFIEEADTYYKSMKKNYVNLSSVLNDLQKTEGNRRFLQNFLPMLAANVGAGLAIGGKPLIGLDVFGGLNLLGGLMGLPPLPGSQSSEAPGGQTQAPGGQSQAPSGGQSQAPSGGQSQAPTEAQSQAATEGTESTTAA